MKKTENKLRVGYWLGNINIESGGIALYAWRMLELLLSQNYEDEAIELVIITYLNARVDNYSPNVELCLIQENLSSLDRLINQADRFFSWFFRKIRFYRYKSHSLNSWFRLFKSLKLDLLYVPYQTPPYYDLPCPLVMTMHDVQELHYPEFFTPQERAHRATYFWKSLESSSSVIVSFEHVKQDLIKYFKLPSCKVFVCPLPYKNIELKQPGADEEELYERKYSGHQNFLLYPAQTWQHKNHLGLISAIEFIKSKHNRLVNVICTGRKTPDFFPVIEQHLEKSEVVSQFLFVGIIPETELLWLYKNCSLVIIPTLYEAGSFPLLEAMSLEVPVVCSSVTSLPETISDSRFVFDPLKIEEVAEMIIRMLDNPELASINIQNGKRRTKQLVEMNSYPSIVNAWKYAISRDDF